MSLIKLLGVWVLLAALVAAPFILGASITGRESSRAR